MLSQDGVDALCLRAQVEHNPDESGFVAAKSETKAEGFAVRSWWTEEMQREVRSDNRYC
jgi:hypothetical protein